ncbi:MAG: hypothetical protein WAL80_05715 [Xanthobacteraceae bacterium]
MANFHSRAALVVIPSVLIILALLSVRSLGGFDSDPEYAYLLNSLMILKFQLPYYFWHPGTTLHVLGAGVIAPVWLARWPSQQLGLQLDVLQHPEFYLSCINAVLAVAIGGACFVLGWRLRIASKSLAIGVIGQALALTSYPALSALSRVSPEPLLLCLSMLLVAILAPRIIAPEPQMESRPVALLAGATVAACVATKLTAIPLALMLLLFETRGMRIISAIAAFMTFLILTLTVAPHYHGMLAWLENMILRKGFYGGGEVGLPSIANIAYGFGLIATAVPELIVTLAGCLVMLLCAPRKRVFVICATIIAVQIAVVAKLPLASYLAAATATSDTGWPVRYLLPATAAVMMAVIVAVHQLMGGSSFRRMTALSIFSVVVGIGVLRNMETNTQELRIHSIARKENRAILAQLASKGCTIVPSYNAIESTKYKLAFGNWWAGGAFDAALAAMYPDFVWFKYSFETYDTPLDAIQARSRLAREKCVYLVGSPFREPYDNIIPGVGVLTTVAVTGRDLGYGYSLGVYQLDVFKDSN